MKGAALGRPFREMTRAQTINALAAPRRLGRYTILEDLARGGMAQVYLAQKDGSEELCVLKQLLEELGTHATAGKRFYREAHVASYLIHPRIARTTDAGFEDGTFCIALEFIAGKDVESIMHHLMRQRRMLPYEVSVAVALGVLDGLEYAHDATDPQGIRLDLVHRDLSPRNVMLGFDGEVKIIDFGLAHGKIDSFKTAPGMVLGTLRYVSPEQAIADPVDRRSDLYSLGILLHEMLTGRPLVPDGKPLEVLTQVLKNVPPPVSSMNPHLPAALDAVVAKALEKEPERRWQNARAFSSALREAAGKLAQVPRSALGEFVRHLFPEDELRTRALITAARRRYESRSRMDASSEEDLRTRMEDTRIGPQISTLTLPMSDNPTLPGIAEAGPTLVPVTSDMHLPTHAEVVSSAFQSLKGANLPTLIASDAKTDVQPDPAAGPTSLTDQTLVLSERPAELPTLVPPPRTVETPLPIAVGQPTQLRREGRRVNLALAGIAVLVVITMALLASGRSRTIDVPVAPPELEAVASPPPTPIARPKLAQPEVEAAPAVQEPPLEAPAPAATDRTRGNKPTVAARTKPAAPPAPHSRGLKAQVEPLLKAGSAERLQEAWELLKTGSTRLTDPKLKARVDRELRNNELQPSAEAIRKIATLMDGARSP